MSKIQIIQESVNIVDVLRYYGVDVENKKCICPFHGDTNASMMVNTTKNKVHCYGCGEDADVVNIVEKMENVDCKTAIEILRERYGLWSSEALLSNEEMDKLQQEVQKRQQLRKQEEEKERAEFKKRNELFKAKSKKYIPQCALNASRTDFFHKRGLTDETIRRFNLGYDVKKKCIVVPYSRSNTYYQIRYINEKKFRKPVAKEAGNEPLYNEELLYYEKTKTDCIFVVESPICAMSISQCGGEAVALCGVANWNKLVDYLRKKKSDKTLVLCLDNDEAGRTTTQKIVTEMDKIKQKYSIENIADECKDPNELLMKDSNRLKENIDKILKRRIYINVL